MAILDHSDKGFPHISAVTEMCMCLDPCCMDMKGCSCRSCPCQGSGRTHADLWEERRAAYERSEVARALADLARESGRRAIRATYESAPRKQYPEWR